MDEKDNFDLWLGVAIAIVVILMVLIQVGFNLAWIWQ